MERSCLRSATSSLRSALPIQHDACMSFDFFVGLHQPSDAKHFEKAFVSVNRLKSRKSSFVCKKIILDSGAFTLVSTYGGYPDSVGAYAEQVVHCKGLIEGGGGELLAAVSQDLMCEPFILEKTGMTVEDHQRLTIERYDALLACDTGVLIMPVLQGFHPDDYVRHIHMYGERLKLGMWVGVGSVCKRNGNIKAIEDVLLTIHHERPDLRLHGFGLKTTALSSGLVQDLLHTADSMAWSFAARILGRNGNDWREAKKWTDRIESRAVQVPLFIPKAS